MADVVLTDNDDLLNGVGEFIPVDENTLLTLMSEEERLKGLAGLSPYHTAAWERAKAEMITPPNNVDLTGTLTELQEKYIKAMCCYLLMESLFTKRSKGDKESNDWRESDRCASRFTEMKSRFPITAPDGDTVVLGDCIQFYRG